MQLFDLIPLLVLLLQAGRRQVSFSVNPSLKLDGFDHGRTFLTSTTLRTVILVLNPLLNYVLVIVRRNLLPSSVCSHRRFYPVCSSTILKIVLVMSSKTGYRAQLRYLSTRSASWSSLKSGALDAVAVSAPFFLVGGVPGV